MEIHNYDLVGPKKLENTYIRFQFWYSICSLWTALTVLFRPEAQRGTGNWDFNIFWKFYFCYKLPKKYRVFLISGNFQGYTLTTSRLWPLILFCFCFQRVRSLLAAGERESQLVGDSGTVWGVALVPRSKEEDSVINPVFVSVGHRLSLETCLALTKAVGRYVSY